jgi:hypothetical protein
MKTAMQELIDELESIKGYKYGGLIIRLMKEKLEKEKEQIINAHGLKYSDITEETVNGEEYYNKTYTQDRELGKEVTDLLENYKKDKTFKQKSKWI